MLTPMVDMFTIRVVFLLMNYSLGGQLMYMAQNILMPESVSREQLEPTVEVAVARDRIYVDGEVVMDDLTEWYAEDKLLMPVLYENLKMKALNFRKNGRGSSPFPFRRKDHHPGRPGHPVSPAEESPVPGRPRRYPADLPCGSATGLMSEKSAWGRR